MSSAPIVVYDPNSIEGVLQQAREELFRNERSFWRNVERECVQLSKECVENIDAYLKDRGIVVPTHPICSTDDLTRSCTQQSSSGTSHVSPTLTDSAHNNNYYYNYSNSAKKEHDSRPTATKENNYPVRDRVNHVCRGSDRRGSHDMLPTYSRSMGQAKNSDEARDGVSVMGRAGDKVKSASLAPEAHASDGIDHAHKHNHIGRDNVGMSKNSEDDVSGKHNSNSNKSTITGSTCSNRNDEKSSHVYKNNVGSDSTVKSLGNHTPVGSSATARSSRLNKCMNEELLAFNESPLAAQVCIQDQPPYACMNSSLTGAEWYDGGHTSKHVAIARPNGGGEAAATFSFRAAAARGTRWLARAKTAINAGSVAAAAREHRANVVLSSSQSGRCPTPSPSRLNFASSVAQSMTIPLLPSCAYQRATRSRNHRDEEAGQPLMNCCSRNSTLYHTCITSIIGSDNKDDGSMKNTANESTKGSDRRETNRISSSLTLWSPEGPPSPSSAPIRAKPYGMSQSARQRACLPHGGNEAENSKSNYSRWHHAGQQDSEIAAGIALEEESRPDCVTNELMTIQSQQMRTDCQCVHTTPVHPSLRRCPEKAVWGGLSAHHETSRGAHALCACASTPTLTLPSHRSNDRNSNNKHDANNINHDFNHYYRDTVNNRSSSSCLRTPLYPSLHEAWTSGMGALCNPEEFGPMLASITDTWSSEQQQQNPCAQCTRSTDQQKIEPVTASSESMAPSLASPLMLSSPPVVRAPRCSAVKEEDVGAEASRCQRGEMQLVSPSPRRVQQTRAAARVTAELSQRLSCCPPAKGRAFATVHAPAQEVKDACYLYRYCNYSGAAHTETRVNNNTTDLTRVAQSNIPDPLTEAKTDRTNNCSTHGTITDDDDAAHCCWNKESKNVDVEHCILRGGEAAAVVVRPSRQLSLCSTLHSQSVPIAVDSARDGATLPLREEGIDLPRVLKVYRSFATHACGRTASAAATATATIAGISARTSAQSATAATTKKTKTATGIETGVRKPEQQPQRAQQPVWCAFSPPLEMPERPHSNTIGESSGLLHPTKQNHRHIDSSCKDETNNSNTINLGSSSNGAVHELLRSSYLDPRNAVATALSSVTHPRHAHIGCNARSCTPPQVNARFVLSPEDPYSTGSSSLYSCNTRRRAGRIFHTTHDSSTRVCRWRRRDHLPSSHSRSQSHTVNACESKQQDEHPHVTATKSATSPAPAIDFGSSAPQTQSKAALLRRVCAVVQRDACGDNNIHDSVAKAIKKTPDSGDEDATAMKWGVADAARTRQSLLAASEALERLMTYAIKPE